MRSLHQASHSYTTSGLHRDGDRQQTENKVGAWMRMPPRGSAQGMMVAATRIQSLDDLPGNRGGTPLVDPRRSRFRALMTVRANLHS